MSILRHEMVPWSDNLHTNLGINRTTVTMHVIGAMVTFNAPLFEQLGVREAKLAISEVMASLPDDDIAELNYAATEMDSWDVMIMFVRKAESLQELHQVIDAIEDAPADED